MTDGFTQFGPAPSLITCADASGLPSLLTVGKKYRVLSTGRGYAGGPPLVRVLSDTGDPHGDSVYAHRFEEFPEECGA